MTSSSYNNDRDRVLAATDILAIIGEQIALRPKGREHLGLCPFHEDHSPSFAVVTHKTGPSGSGFYKCFSCGAAGNAIDFVMNYHRMEFRETLQFLASRAGVELTPWEARGPARASGEPTRDDVHRANALAENFFRRVLKDEDAGRKARTEIERRGFGAEIVAGFGLGAAPAKSDALAEGIKRAISNTGSGYPSIEAFLAAGVIRPARSGGGAIDLLRDRLVFPIYDDMGRPIAFGGRKLDPEQEPKYLNSPESPVFSKSRTLYGIHRAKRQIIECNQAIVTEGYTDVIACHRAGVTNTVATLGTALTRDHARMLRRLSDNVILLFDGDEAGQKAADRALEVFFSEPIDIKICVLPDNLDPDDLLRQENGVERFRNAVAQSVDALPFMASRVRRQLTGRGLSGRQQLIEQTMQKFVDLGLNAMNGLRRNLVMQTISDLFNLSTNELDRLAKSLRSRQIGNSGSQAENEGSARTATTLVEPSPAGLQLRGRQKARHSAQERLLALLCCDPALAALAVPLDGGGTLPISEALSPDSFADQGHRAIFQAVRNATEEARVLTFDSLLGDLDHPHLKRLASDLYTFGKALLHDSNTLTNDSSTEQTLAHQVLVSWEDLEKIERLDRFAHGAQPTDAFQSPSESASHVSSADPHSSQPPSTQTQSNQSNQTSLSVSDAADRIKRARARGHDAAAPKQLQNQNIQSRRPSTPANQHRSNPL